MKLEQGIEKVMSLFPKADIRQLAAEVIKIVPQDELVPLVSEYLARLLRERTRELERSAFVNLAKERTRTTLALPEPSNGHGAANLAVLANNRFSRGDGSEVAWLQATKGDHRARISFLESTRKKFNTGIDQTINRHRKAIALIDSYGVTCLADLAGPSSPALNPVVLDAHNDSGLASRAAVERPLEHDLG